MERKNRLTKLVRVSLFFLSYTPLFFIVIIRELKRNKEYLNWGGFTLDSLKCFIKFFLLPTMLGVFIFIGVFCTKYFFKRMSFKVEESGDNVIVKRIENKNSEAISYLATYILPFLFQDFSNIIDTISIFVIFWVIYRIYINSSLLIINPILNLEYTLYEIGYVDKSDDIKEKKGTLIKKNREKNGILICKQKYLEEEDEVRIKDIGHKLYFGILKEEEE